ncbi:protein HIRA [Cimex lectularius]|uniref:Protein HIRA n=1 Tax=Cimex lectularius TaxID=79782 RepID=A0A8I6RSL0_CIMLE|nr:protein HIRA [Cimex lectularius]
MKVFKPHWIGHEGKPIYSIDIHPDGSRVATGGQGINSGRIVIWNMAPILSEESEEDPNVPKMLCQMDNHLACVNCVRWSYSGRYLASGGDDKLIMVWTISKSFSGNMVFGSKGKVNVEGWRCAYTLRNHQGDVLDMAWSPGDHWLASCSVDNTIIIWKADSFPETTAVLKGHTGLVKGVSWDPVGKYLGSQSDDKTVRIWRTSDWCTEKVIKKPFEKCSGSTLVLRLSWSPDGQTLVTAHAMNGTGPTAQIIERDGWDYSKDFVGHIKAVTCARYSSSIMELFRRGKPVQACVCALGSRDCSISVWSTLMGRPLVVIKDLFNSPVLDICWSKSGSYLMACAGDGTTALLQFELQEIGRPITEMEKGQTFEKLYGKFALDGIRETMVIENPDLFSNCVKKEKSPILPDKEENKETLTNGYLPAHQSPSPTPTNTQVSQSESNFLKRSTKQIETRTSDGRRRITPIFIPLNQDKIDEITPFGSDSVPSFSSCMNKSRIVVEKREDVIVIPNVTPVKSSSQTQTKRPTMNTSLSNSSDATQPSGFTGLVSTAEKTESKRRISKRPTLKLTETSPASPKKKKKKGHHRCSPQKKTASHLLVCDLLPKLELSTVNNIKMFKSRNYINIENNISKASPQGCLSVVRMFSPDDNKPLWELALGSEVCGCVGSSDVVALACDDQTLRVIEPKSGAHLAPPVALASSPAVLTLSSSFVLSITTSGNITVLSTDPKGSTPKAVLSDKSLASLVSAQGELRIKECLVTETGEPMVALTCGKAFLYSLIHNCWLLVGNSNDAVLRNTQHSYRNSLRYASANESLPLKSIQAATFNGLSSGVGRLVQNTELGPLCTLSFLDMQMASAQALSSKAEYKFWLITYVRFLIHQGLELKLRLVCEELLGPSHSTSTNNLFSSWNKQILGLNKHSLLRDVLKEMSNNIKLQRLYTEISSQLDRIADRCEEPSEQS